MSRIYILFIILLTLVDQLSKIAIKLLSNGVSGYSIRVFGDFLRFTYIENHGGIFGIFQGHIIIFTIISLVLMVYVYKTELKNFSEYSESKKIAACFIISGALGNMIDRIFRGYVIDMIDFRTIWSFIFNVADVYIHIGIYILLISYLLKRGNKK